MDSNNVATKLLFKIQFSQKVNNKTTCPVLFYLKNSLKLRNQTFYVSILRFDLPVWTWKGCCFPVFASLVKRDSDINRFSHFMTHIIKSFNDFNITFID